jgi:hypothetical protein
VVGEPPPDHDLLLGVADPAVVLVGELDRRLVRLGAARHQPRVLEPVREERGEALGEPPGRAVDEQDARRVLEPRQLVVGGVRDRRHAVTDVRTLVARDRVEIPGPVPVVEVRPLAADDLGVLAERPGEHVGRPRREIPRRDRRLIRVVGHARSGPGRP